jgi:arginine:pyruvate transaminase
MVDVRATGLSGEEFAWRLLAEHNVATMPGESFGAAGGGHVRVSLTADDEDIRRGCERIITMAEGLADKT